MAYRKSNRKVSRYKTKSSKAMRVRGGFALPNVPRNAIPAAKRIYSDIKRLQGSRTLENATRLGSSVKSLTDIYYKTAGVTTSPNPKGAPGYPKGKDLLTNIVQERTTKMSGSNMIQSAKKFKSLVKTGVPSTSTVKRCAKNYGTTKAMLYNSERDATVSARGQMSTNYGFNQKCFFVPTGTSSYFTAFEYADAWKSDLAAAPQSGTQLFYGLAMNQRNQYKISNSNTYFPVKVKAHLVAAQNPSVDPTEMRTKVFNTNIGDQNNSAIPELFQFSLPDIKTEHYDVLCDTKANLKQSAYFRENLIVLRTISKRLAPGDVWELTNTHEFGAGIDLFLTKQTAATGSLNPMGPFWIFELEGIQCEGVDKATGATYIGTSPGMVSYEHSKQWEQVNSPVPEFTPDGVITTKAYKVYDSYITRSEPRYNVNYESIGAPDGSETVAYIPVVSDAQRTFAQSAVQQDPDSPAAQVTNNYYVVDELPSIDAEFEEECADENEI